MRQRNWKVILYLHEACRWADERDSPSDQSLPSFVFQGFLRYLCCRWKRMFLWKPGGEKLNHSLCTYLQANSAIVPRILKGTWSFCGRESRSPDIVGLSSISRLFLWGARGQTGRHTCWRLHHGPLVLIVMSGFWEPAYKHIWLLKRHTEYYSLCM